MEDIISKITTIYQKEKENKPKNESTQKNEIKILTDKIYVINPKELDIEQDSSKKQKEFSNSLYEGLNEKEMSSFLTNNNIPVKYLTKVLKEIFKIITSSKENIKNKSKDTDKNIKLLLIFLEKNKDKITEKHILYIFKKIKDYNKNEISEIIKYIIMNINIDNKYFLELLKEDEIELNKNIIDSLNNYEYDINNKDKINFLNLMKTLNLISLLKEIINRKEYENFEEKINKEFEEILSQEENCKNLCDKEFNEDFNIEFINSMKIINSNPNKSYYIQEKLTI
jgi:hypothetical protein